MSKYEILHPKGIGKVSEDGLHNILRFGCFEFMKYGERQCEGCTCGHPVGATNDKDKIGYFGCRVHPSYAIIDENLSDFPEIKNNKSDLQEGYCSLDPELGPRNINIRGIILGNGGNIDSLIMEMKMGLSCLKDTLYVKVGCRNFKVEAEVTNVDIKGDTFDISFCTQPYYEDCTKNTLDEVVVEGNEGSFKVENMWATTCPEFKIEIKEGMGTDMVITYGDSEIKVYGNFIPGDIICLNEKCEMYKGEGEDAELLHYDGCFEKIKNKKEYEFNISFGTSIIDPTETEFNCDTMSIPPEFVGNHFGDYDMCVPIDVSGIDCLQKIIMDWRIGLNFAGQNITVNIDIYSDANKTNNIFSQSETSITVSNGIRVFCQNSPIYTDALDVSALSTIYVNWEFIIGGGFFSQMQVGAGPGNVVEGIKVYSTTTKDYCICENSRRCNTNPTPSGFPGWLTSQLQVTQPTTFSMQTQSQKDYTSKVTLFLEKTAGMPDADITLRIKNSIGGATIYTDTVTLVQGVSYNEVCFEIDPPVATPNGNYVFEFLIDPGTGGALPIYMGDPVSGAVWINGVLQTGGQANNGLFFDSFCTDEVIEPEEVSVEKFCINYCQKNRFL